MVQAFTIDSMHCLSRNVITRFFSFLRGTASQSLNKTLKNTEWLECGKTWKGLNFPIEFNRRPNSFKKWDSFKCTELRMFGLYGMDIIIRKFCPERVVQAAIYSLVIGMRIVSDPKLFRKHWRLAKSLFTSFLSNCAAKFVERFISLAIHHIIHLPEETIRFNSPVDVLSCFKFENTLGILKKAVKSRSHPLVNISKTLSSQNTFISNAGGQKKPTSLTKFPHVCKKIPSGEDNDAKYMTVYLRKFKLNVLREADSFFSARGKIRLLKYIQIDEDGNILLYSSAFGRLVSAYYVLGEDSKKIFSMEARTCVVSNPEAIAAVSIKDVTQKYVVHSIYGSLFAYPLLHS